MSARKGKKTKRALFPVRNADCITRALAIEKRLKGVDGVERVAGAIVLNKIFVDYDESKVDASEITLAIKEAGYSNHVINDDSMR